MKDAVPAIVRSQWVWSRKKPGNWSVSGHNRRAGRTTWYEVCVRERDMKIDKTRLCYADGKVLREMAYCPTRNATRVLWLALFPATGQLGLFSAFPDRSSAVKVQGSLRTR